MFFLDSLQGMHVDAAVCSQVQILDTFNLDNNSVAILFRSVLLTLVRCAVFLDLN